MNEEIVLVNDEGKPIGTAPKLAAHTANTPLHLAFSCYLFNKKGQFLLTQRALSKKVWPGVWTNSVCGHPAPNEDIKAAIRRRAQYELGLPDVKDLRPILENYRYKTPPYNGIIENEICPVFVGAVDSEPAPNPDEVEAYKWASWDEVDSLIAKDPEAYSYWFKDQLKQLHGLLDPIYSRVGR
ncbi:MAG TPA: isopentenyl-diphosphate Delta-isomerase [Candidatus Saccharimonadales bacterium]|nr:isopentenyl-diphosphate Delta-isomerase [Candidatus Saccharimonadales bacterium]